MSGMMAGLSRPFSRLSDKVGGGTPLPDIVTALNGTTSVDLPALLAGDLLLVFQGNTTTTIPTLISGYTNIATVQGTGTNTSAVLASFRKLSANEAANTLTGSGQTRLYVIVLRGASGIGQFATYAPSTDTTGYQAIVPPGAVAGSRIISAGNSNFPLQATNNFTGWVIVSRGLVASLSADLPIGTESYNVGSSTDVAAISVEVLAA